MKNSGVMNTLENLDVKKFIILNIPYILFFYLANKAGQAFRLSPGNDTSAKVLNIQSGFAAAFSNPLPSLNTQDLIVALIGTAAIALILHVKRQDAKKYRKGVLCCKGWHWITT